MKKSYVSKVVQIEAIQFDGTVESLTEIVSWVNDNGGTARAYCNNGECSMDDHSITIDTLEGSMRGQIGDYIIKGLIGEFYPCKPGVFEAKYEAIQ